MDDPGDSQVYNISDEVTQICQKLGLYPSNVGRITIYPSELRAEVMVFELNEHGRKFVVLDPDDERHGQAAVRELTFRVRT